MKPLSLLSVFICVHLWLIPSSARAEVTNLAPNPGMEDAGEKNLPAHWQPLVVSAPGEIVVDPNVKHSGKQSVRITAPENTRLYVISDPIPVAPGEKITASAWVKFKDVPADKGTMIMIARWTNSKDGGADVSKFAVAEHKKITEADWQKISGTQVVPEGMNNLRIQLGFSYASGTVWWDDVTTTAKQPLVARIELPAARLSPASGTIPVSILNRDGSHGKVSVAVSLGKVSGPPKNPTTRPLVENSMNVDLTGQPKQLAEIPLNITERGQRMSLSATLSKAGQEIFMDRRAVIVPPAVRLQPIVPTHWCTEDGPAKISCQADLALKPDTMKSAKLAFHLLDSSGKSVFDFEAPTDKKLGDGSNVFDMTLPKLPEGSYMMSAEVQSNEAKSITSEQAFGIIPRRLAKVTINADGYCVYDGKPIFPIGIYNGGAHTKEMGESGFTVNHTYNSANVELGEAPNDIGAQDFLDQSEKAGMKVCFLIPRGLVFHGDWDGLRHRVRMLRNHPGLLCWDEEEGIARGDMKPDSLIKLRQILQEEDPNHPLMVGDSRDLITRMGDRTNFFPADQMDMGMWWWYPLPLGAHKGDALEGEDAAAGTNLDPPVFLTKRNTQKPIWLGIQSYKKNDKSRYPTPAEYRAQAYMTVIHGGQGIMWYGGSVTGGAFLNLQESHWDDLKKLATELHSMIPVFMSKTIESPMASPEKSQMSTAIKADGNHIVLLTCNRSTSAADVTIESKQIHAGELTVLQESRKIKAENGSIKDHFEPLDVHVYELAR